MPAADRDTLKTYFQTGDRPTQAQFIDLIDSPLSLSASLGVPLQSTACLQALTNSEVSQSGSIITFKTASDVSLAGSLAVTGAVTHSSSMLQSGSFVTGGAASIAGSMFITGAASAACLRVTTNACVGNQVAITGSALPGVNLTISASNAFSHVNLFRGNNGANGGVGILALLDTDPTTGQRMGFYGFGASTSTGANVATALMGAYATESQTGATARGTDLYWETILNTTNTRVERMRLTNKGNFYIGSSALATINPTTGSPVFVMDQMSSSAANPTGMPADTAGIFVKSVTGTAELFTIDEAGNVTQQTPHSFTLFEPDKSYEVPYVYRSVNHFLGKEIEVDMFGVIRELEKLTSKQFIYMRDLPPEEIDDWDENEERKSKRVSEKISMYDSTSEEDRKELGWMDRPQPYAKKLPPDWLGERLASRMAKNEIPSSSLIMNNFSINLVDTSGSKVMV